MIDHRKLRITTLGENTSTRVGILGEWGLCLLIEDGVHHYLLDTGAGPSTAHNADRLGVDLSRVDAIVLSHGHHDHTGGMAALLPKMGRTVRVIAHPAVFEPKVGGTEVEYHDTSMPQPRGELEALGARFELSTGPTWLTPDIVASGEEPMTTPFEHVSSRSRVLREGRAVQDTLPDDQSLYLRTDLGLVILMGCAHRGIINIIRHALTLFESAGVYLVLGGTHLAAADEDQISATINELRARDVSWLGVSHCTGLRAANRLAAVFGGRFFPNNAGTILTLPLGK